MSGCSSSSAVEAATPTPSPTPSPTPTPTPTPTPGPVATPGANSLLGNVVNFGDSITCGAYAGPPESSYTVLLDAHFQGTNSDLCHFGDQAADMAWNYVYPNAAPTTTESPTVTAMVGTNDAHFCSTLFPGCLQNYTLSLYGSIAWLALPRTDKLFAQSASVSRTGSWSAFDLPIAGLGLASTGVGDTLSFTVTQAVARRRLYLAWHGSANDSGSAALFLDGTQIDTLVTNGGTEHTIATNNGGVNSVLAQGYPLGAVGKHTVLIRTLPHSTDVGSFALYWAGVSSRNYILPHSPRVLLGGVLRFQRGDEDTNTGALDAAAQSVAGTLSADGLDVEYVDTRDAVNPFSDMADGVHPNAVGHANLAAAFLTATLDGSSAP